MSSKFLNLAKAIAKSNPSEPWFYRFLQISKTKPEPPYNFAIQIGDPRLREISDSVPIGSCENSKPILQDDLAVQTVKRLLEGLKIVFEY